MQVYTVSDLTFAIKKSLETDFREVSVQGEISNLKVHTSGHIYFSLKDKEAMLSAAFFKGHALKASRLPKEGDQVTVVGDISVYPPRGGYQILVREISFNGVGELLLAFQMLKERLLKEGLFDEKHKKKLPSLPKRIGVITSPTGAVIKDILHVLKRRFSNFHLILNPVKVQGEGSALEIAAAIDQFNQYDLADVLIVGRGGGSLEDLWAFNEEIVARAIFRSQIPVVSAVGHETDYTIADFVADVRAPTPSAAAEIVSKEKEELLKFLRQAFSLNQKGILRELARKKESFQSLKRQRILSDPSSILGGAMQLLDEGKSELDLHMKHLLKNEKMRLIHQKERLQGLSPLALLEKKKIEIKNYLFALQNFPQKIHIYQQKLTHLTSHLKTLDPKNLLKKGYSILFSEKTGSVILSTSEVLPDERIPAVMHDGVIHALTTKG